MKQKDYDQNLIVELRKIKVPIYNKNGIPVFFSERNKKESCIEHIANKKHHLKVRDIKQIEIIIKNPIRVQILNNKTNKRAYYGIRPGKKKMFLVLILRHFEECEKIITFYPTRKYL